MLASWAFYWYKIVLMAGEKAQPIFENVYELYPGCLDMSPVAEAQKAVEPPKRPVDPDN